MFGERIRIAVVLLLVGDVRHVDETRRLRRRARDVALHQEPLEVLPYLRRVGLDHLLIGVRRRGHFPHVGLPQPHGGIGAFGGGLAGDEREPGGQRVVGRVAVVIAGAIDRRRVGPEEIHAELRGFRSVFGYGWPAQPPAPTQMIL